MSDDQSKSLDVLGIKPVADAISTITKSAVDGASAFLGRICLPVAEELGLLLQDKIRAWRSHNAICILAETERCLKENTTSESVHAHPRLVAAAIEHGSWSDDHTIQKMWGGLLASSCTTDGKDDSNLIFTVLLAQLTGCQARILDYSCSNTAKELSSLGLIVPKARLIVDVKTIKTIAQTENIHKLDIELDRLRSLELIDEGFNSNHEHATITATTLAMNMYARCVGIYGGAIDYFKLPTEPRDGTVP